MEISGAKIILLPLVETKEIEISPENEKLLKNLSEFDWLVFQNIYAVDYFLQALERFEIDIFELDALRVLAFGETVADRLRYSQVHSDIISKTLETTEILQSLCNYEPDFGYSNFLIPTENQRKPEIFDALSKTGSNVIVIPLYKTGFSDQMPKLKALIKGGAIDEFIFSSPTDAANLTIIFHPEGAANLLSETLVSSKDSQTFQSLLEIGIKSKIKR